MKGDIQEKGAVPCKLFSQHAPLSTGILMLILLLFCGYNLYSTMIKIYPKRRGSKQRQKKWGRKREKRRRRDGKALGIPNLALVSIAAANINWNGMAQ